MCAVAHCGRPLFAKGLCRKHYDQQRNARRGKEQYDRLYDGDFTNAELLSMLLNIELEDIEMYANSLRDPNGRRQVL